jgi:glyoxylate/hydroxypyruvate reductase
MRIHVQNDPSEPLTAITPDLWHAAARAAGEPVHAVSFATAPDGFASVRDRVELLIGPAVALRALRPLLAPRLRLMSVMSSGIDGLGPLDWLPPDVTVLNNRGTHGPKAGAFVAMAVLMLAARMPELIAAQREATWRPLQTPGVAGQRALVVGTGDLGSAAARQLRALGMRVGGISRSGAAHPDFDDVGTDLDAALAEATFLVIACPLTPATRGLLDRARIARLPRGAGVVNIGRGAVLDQAALCDALETGHLGGAVLDVFAPEPPPPEDRVWRTCNLIVTPHISCDDGETYVARSLAILFANLRAVRAGEAPPNRVDPARGY